MDPEDLAPPPEFTVEEAMVECDIDDEDQFEGRTAAERIASDLFQDDFKTCMDKTFEELESDLKSFSTLTQNQGQIRLTPGQKNKIKAFIQWTRDTIGKD